MYKKRERHSPVCLECGDHIRYGRADKKFCSDECRVRNYNERSKKSRIFKRRILRILFRNYEILDALIRADVESADLINLVPMGFVPSIMTSCRKCGKHDECGCFDIRYIKTSARIYSIAKIENFD
ncbi:MAG: hypothetical protein J6R15_03220 [Bacteroidales bacterium]|jgi:predicted nucleic acid-binding Zn ribbon protein|nr:hypothetical protein [Bacteroidales bacterium]